MKEDIVNKVEYLEMVKVVANHFAQKYIECRKAKGLQASTFTSSVDDPYFSDETNSGFISVSMADSTPMFALKSEKSCAQICDVYSETCNYDSQDMASEFSDDSGADVTSAQGKFTADVEIALNIPYDVVQDDQVVALVQVTSPDVDLSDIPENLL